MRVWRDAARYRSRRNLDLFGSAGESAFAYVGADPLQIGGLLVTLPKGKAALKAEIASETAVEATHLPYDDRVLALVREAREAGRPVHLASASNERYVRAVAEHLGLFDGWFASNKLENLSSSAKARRLAAALGTLVSLAITGFVFAIGNNLFHLPIVAELWDEPQFTNDEFIQALRYYAAGPWMLLRGSASYVNPYWSFLLLFVISRLLSIVGFLACARLLGIVSRSQQICFALLVSVTWLLRGDAVGGGGGLFIDYFAHSEMANGLVLLALYLVFRLRIATAIAMVGVIFFVNAFMGVWTAVVVGVVFVAQIARGI